MAFTIYTGDIILKKNWVIKIEKNYNLKTTSRENSRKKLNYYKIYMTFIILTLLHEYSHVYRKRYIADNHFDTTPSFSILHQFYDDSGKALDNLIFDEYLIEIYDEQAEFILNVNTWKNLKTKKEFIKGFKSIKRKNNSTSLRLKRSKGPLLWKDVCYRCAMRR